MRSNRLRCAGLFVALAQHGAVAQVATHSECMRGHSDTWNKDHLNPNTTEWPGVMCFDETGRRFTQASCAAFCASCASDLDTSVGSINFNPHHQASGGCRCYSEEQARQMRMAGYTETWNPSRDWQYCRTYNYLANTIDCGNTMGGPRIGIPLGGNNDGGRTNNGICTGECDADSQCNAGLKCFQREQREPIPGCVDVDAGYVGDGARTASPRNWDYCYDPKDPDIPSCYRDFSLELCRQRCEMASDCTMFNWAPSSKTCCVKTCMPPGTGFAAPDGMPICQAESLTVSRGRTGYTPEGLTARGSCPGNYRGYLSMGVISGEDYRPDVSTKMPSWARTNNNGECYGGNLPSQANNGDQADDHGNQETYHSCVRPAGQTQWWAVKLKHEATNPRVRFITRDCCVGNMVGDVEFYIGPCQESGINWNPLGNRQADRYMQSDLQGWKYGTMCKSLELADTERYGFVCEGKGECVYVVEKGIPGRSVALDFAQLTVYAHTELDTATGLIDDVRSDLQSGFDGLASLNASLIATRSGLTVTQSTLVLAQSTLAVTQSELSAATSTLVDNAAAAAQRSATLSQIKAAVADRVIAARATASGASAGTNPVATPKITTADGDLELAAPMGKVVSVNGNPVADRPAVASEVNQTLGMLIDLIEALN